MPDFPHPAMVPFGVVGAFLNLHLHHAMTDGAIHHLFTFHVGFIVPTFTMVLGCIPIIYRVIELKS